MRFVSFLILVLASLSAHTSNFSQFFPQAQKTSVAKFTSSGTWTLPSGVNIVDILAVGGGGGGGPGVANCPGYDPAGFGTGGGGGQVVFAEKFLVSGNLTVTIGAGGLGTVGGNGQSGGTTTIAQGATILVRAIGGVGGGSPGYPGGGGGNGGAGGNSGQSGKNPTLGNFYFSGLGGATGNSGGGGGSYGDGAAGVSIWNVVGVSAAANSGGGGSGSGAAYGNGCDYGPRGGHGGSGYVEIRY